MYLEMQLKSLGMSVSSDGGGDSWAGTLSVCICGAWYIRVAQKVFVEVN